MNLRPIVAAAPEVALRGTVLRLVQQQGINSLEPLVDNLEQLARPYAVDPVSAVVITGESSTGRADPPSKDTPLSSAKTTASCIVLGASCF
jgi:hypothetical protein